MTQTPHLGLPLIAAAQAQKHVTHNEALFGVDAVVQLAVIDRDLATPPASPSEGDRYIVAAPGLGAWAGKAGLVAAWRDGLWRFHAPSRGWLAYVLDEGALVTWNGSAWTAALAASAEFQNLTRLGLGTTADAGNPFSAKINDGLFAARAVGEGGTGDLRLKFNKETPSRILSLLLQSGWSGRAELGLTGDDDFRVKVSADGALWTEALRISRATGQVSFPAGAALPSGQRNRVSNGNFAVNQRGFASGASLGAGAYGHDRWKAGAGGCSYGFGATRPDTILSITAGTLVQVVEDQTVEGGAYTLSWTGTAQGRLGLGGAAPAGAFGPSPISVSGAAAGQAITLEFATGTLGKVQLDPGGTATEFERRPVDLELARCQRTYCKVRASLQGRASAAAERWGTSIVWPVTMRAAPTVTLGGSAFSVNCTPFTTVEDPSGAGFFVDSVASGNFADVARVIIASAEL